MRLNNKQIAKWVGTVLGIGMLIWFLSLISIDDLLQGLSSLSWQVLAITALLSLLSYLFRAARFYHPLNKRIPLYDLFIIALIHTFTNTALPARSGEFSFLYYAKKYSGLPLGYLTSSLVFIRYLELFVLTASFPLMLAFIDTRNTMFDVLFITSIALSIILMSVCILGFRYHRALLKWLLNIQIRSTLHKHIVTFGIHFFEMIADVSQKPKHILWSLFYTMCVWYTAFLSTYILVQALHVPLSFSESTLSGLFVILTGLLPISGFMGIGLWEGAWVAALTLQGVDHEVAITSGIVMHTIRVVLLVAFGGLGFVLHAMRKEPAIRSVRQEETATIAPTTESQHK